MIRVRLVEIRYPAPEDDGADYCPDPEVTGDDLQEVGFRELVRLMEAHPFPSCSPPRGKVYEWLNAEPYQHMDGEIVERSMHYVIDQHGRHARYWRLAMIAAGIIKRPAPDLPPLFSWYDTHGYLCIQLTEEDARSATHPGPCDADVAALSCLSYVEVQLLSIAPDTARDVLREYGAWDDEELADHAQNLARLLWLAAGGICDELAEAEG